MKDRHNLSRNYLKRVYDLLMVLLLNVNRVSYKISYVNYHIGID